MIAQVRRSKSAVKWDYLFLNIQGHNQALHEADNMLVTTSDGR